MSSDSATTNPDDRTAATTSRPRPIRVAFGWSNISGYMAVCWRALSKHPDFDITVISRRSGESRFDDAVMAGITYVPLTLEEYSGKVADRVAACDPDIVVLAGWIDRSLRRMPFDPRFRNAKFIMTMDTPWRGTLRQRLGGLFLHRYLSRMSHVVCPGERAWTLARQMGVSGERLSKGMYAIDFDRLRDAHAARAARAPGDWPRRFIYIGRYAEEKGLEVLVEGYRRYRTMVKDPWPLTCMGSGPLASALEGVEGVTNVGFVQPADQPALLAEHGAFVLASHYDPWPLVIVESCAAGLPIVHSDACGSAVELVRPFFNGLSFAAGDPAHLASRLAWVHDHPDVLPAWGERSRQLASAYSAEMWVERWVNILRGVMQGPG